MDLLSCLYFVNSYRPYLIIRKTKLIIEENHAHKMIQAAREITAFVEETKNDMAVNDLTFDIRIGINSGPVVAGVVSIKNLPSTSGATP